MGLIRVRRLGGWMIAVAWLCTGWTSPGCGRGRDAREDLGEAAKVAVREESSGPASGEGVEARPVSDEAAPPSSAAAGLPSAGSRRPAPDFKLPDLDGNDVRLSQFKGKVVLVNFWATWCPPCRAEIPDFIELQRDLGPKGLQIVGISLDDKGARVVRPFAAQNRINYAMLVNGQPAATLYGGISAIPTTFLVDRQGRIVASQRGLASKQYWKSSIAALLSEP